MGGGGANNSYWDEALIALAAIAASTATGGAAAPVVGPVAAGLIGVGAGAAAGAATGAITGEATGEGAGAGARKGALSGAMSGVGPGVGTVAGGIAGSAAGSAAGAGTQAATTGIGASTAPLATEATIYGAESFAAPALYSAGGYGTGVAGGATYGAAPGALSSVGPYASGYVYEPGLAGGPTGVTVPAPYTGPGMGYNVPIEAGAYSPNYSPNAPQWPSWLNRRNVETGAVVIGQGAKAIQGSRPKAPPPDATPRVQRGGAPYKNQGEEQMQALIASIAERRRKGLGQTWGTNVRIF